MPKKTKQQKWLYIIFIGGMGNACFATKTGQICTVWGKLAVNSVKIHQF